MGIFLLVAAAILWVRIVIAVLSDFGEALYTVLGGIVATLIPIAFGMYAFMRGRDSSASGAVEGVDRQRKWDTFGPEINRDSR